MRSVRRVGEAGTHPTSTDHVSGPIQTASNGETVGKNQVNSLYMNREVCFISDPGNKPGINQLHKPAHSMNKLALPGFWPAG